MMCPEKNRHEILGKGGLKNAEEIQQRVEERSSETHGG